jgi:predicted DNA-binding transcriptional regulator AlpA
MFEEAIKELIEQAANRAAEKAIRRYAEEHKPKPSRYGDRMTVEDIMRETGFARQTVYQKHSNKAIPGAVKVGSKLMFVTAQVMPWIESGCPTLNAR